MNPAVDELQHIAYLLVATMSRMDQAVDRTTEVSARAIALRQSTVTPTVILSAGT